MLHVENICMIRDVHGILFLCICHYFTTILPQNMIDVPEKYDLVFFSGFVMIRLFAIQQNVFITD